MNKTDGETALKDLPEAQDAAAPQEAWTSNGDSANNLSGSAQRRILIVDDEESVLWSLSKSLSLADKNLEIGTASSAEEALAFVKQHPVDLVITDLKLPNMDGLELTKSVHSTNPETKAILMTAFGNEQIQQEASDNGCIGYLEKPFDIESLLDYIHAALDHHGEFRADLTNLTLTEILQLYGQRHKSAVLSVVSNGAAGMIVIDRGTISHVQFNDKEGPEALLAIVECGSGTISSLSCSPPPRSTMKVSWEVLENAIKLRARGEQIKMLQGELTEPINESKTEAGSISHEEAIAELRKRFDQLTGVSGKPTFGGLPLRVGKNDPSSVNGAAIDRDRPEKRNFSDFGETELMLAPEPPQAEEVYVPTPKERRDTKIKQFINEGVDHFKAHRLDEAREAWRRALRFDEKCAEAWRNLEILDQVEEAVKNKNKKS